MFSKTISSKIEPHIDFKSPMKILSDKYIKILRIPEPKNIMKPPTNCKESSLINSDKLINYISLLYLEMLKKKNRYRNWGGKRSNLTNWVSIQCKQINQTRRYMFLPSIVNPFVIIGYIVLHDGHLTNIPIIMTIAFSDSYPVSSPVVKCFSSIENKISCNYFIEDHNNLILSNGCEFLQNNWGPVIDGKKTDPRIYPSLETVVASYEQLYLESRQIIHFNKNTKDKANYRFKSEISYCVAHSRKILIETYFSLQKILNMHGFVLPVVIPVMGDIVMVNPLHMKCDLVMKSVPRFKLEPTTVSYISEDLNIKIANHSLVVTQSGLLKNLQDFELSFILKSKDGSRFIRWGIYGYMGIKKYNADCKWSNHGAAIEKFHALWITISHGQLCISIQYNKKELPSVVGRSRVASLYEAFDKNTIFNLELFMKSYGSKQFTLTQYPLHHGIICGSVTTL
jgi:hypothetical protein